MQHTCCATMFAAPVAAAFALSRSSRLASLSKAHTVPLPPIKATKATEQPRQNPKWRYCISLSVACIRISDSMLHKRVQLPRHRLKNTGQGCVKVPATWVVLLPGAAHASSTCQPGWGAKACAGRQLALLCRQSMTE